ncbi:MAG: chromosome segregation protein SMC [Pyramidobacter sp.]|uniref:chromosome segregation protein SMC n=1 Tax=Pyramidobacter sp. TaxID=1943581 RepID=UPI002A810319|nr:chromosome segregation protein SMC [Pyramidobacter sp.]MDY4033419.1 chromosome segregation protein SMC [Pyramidobacter sp.]
MFIERLTLKNFKSFGGTHELPFAPGFTAIVGPNGSGKSNILDGLRWVLGESGAVRLRITRQSDLIFQGSAGLSEAAETDVTLDLNDGGARGSLRRHLDASGGTIYVNGARMRIQDLTQFKQQWRLEGDRSAFIGQGEVGAAVLQKPFQRRLQLEELFGIDLYRKKRDGALDELKQSGDELLRLHTLMGELRARREEIAPDLQNARKAKDYQERLEDLRRVLYHYRRCGEETRLETLARKHEESGSRLESAERWASLWKNALERLRAQGSEYARRRGELNDELEELTPRLDDALRREMALNAEKSESEFAARRASEERDRLEEQMKKEETLRSELAVQTGRLTQEASSLDVQIHDLEDRLASRDAALEETRRKRQELLEREAGLLEEARQMDARAETLGLQSRERSAVLDDLRAKRDGMVSKMTESDEALEALEDALEQLEKKRGEAAARSQEMAIRAQSVRRSIAKAEAELDGLLQRAEAGLYPRPVQMVLSAVKLGRLKIETIPAVEGFSCDGSLAPCLEAYLGGRQYWLLVDTMAQARVGIDLLKERSGGRATFLPLERCRSPRPGKAPAGSGVLGWAIDLVAPDKRWLPAMEHLLGDLLVVKDYDTGARLAATARYPIVTVDGEVFSPSGTVSGGKNARSAGAITLRNMIDETEKRIAADKKAQAEIVKALEAAERAETKAGEALEKQRAAASEQKSRTEALRRALREQTEELNALLQEDSNSAERIDHCRAEAKKMRESAAQARAEIDALPLSAGDDAESARLAELRTQGLLTGERLTAKKSELEKSVRVVSDLRRALSANTEESRRIVQKLAELAGRQEAVLKEKGAREAEKRAVQKQIAELDKHNADAARRMERQLLRSQRAQTAFDSLTRDELMVRNEIEKAHERLDSLIADNEEKYPYPADFIPGDESVDKLENSCRYLERSLKDLGDVNMGALSEDQSLSERLEFLDGQLKDVQHGMDELRALIANTDKQAGTMFNGALVKIDRRFDELFQRLFGGGEAHLKAQEDMDLWEAGVEIVARPPGKKPLFLAQLSGGEQSLTALSLLFASMEVAKVPLAVLDEVDAALDEANLTRFAQMVADYSKNLQVIAMTHRRQTMEHAEVMYGVTMSEPGLSQIVSVKVDQWN